jgi:hypothetical protein
MRATSKFSDNLAALRAKVKWFAAGEEGPSLRQFGV